MKNKDPLLKMNFDKEKAKNAPHKIKYLNLAVRFIIFVTIAVLVILWLIEQMKKIGTLLTSNNEYKKLTEMFYPMNSTFLNVNV
jgi:hypothetical protein